LNPVKSENKDSVNRDQGLSLGSIMGFDSGWCSLVMMVVIFFINAHMLIPTISGIMDTKDEQKLFSMILITFNYNIT
jgi:hypothetical protein